MSVPWPFSAALLACTLTLQLHKAGWVALSAGHIGCCSLSADGSGRSVQPGPPPASLGGRCSRIPGLAHRLEFVHSIHNFPASGGRKDKAGELVIKSEE